MRADAFGEIRPVDPAMWQSKLAEHERLLDERIRRVVKETLAEFFTVSN